MDNGSKNLLEQVIESSNKLSTVAREQTKMIDKLIELTEILNNIIDTQDRTIDTQAQTLQLLELKLKEFGFTLDPD